VIARDNAAAHWGLGGWMLVAASFAVGFASFPLRTVGMDFEYLPGDPGDNRLNNYILEHGYRWLTRQAPSFWDAPMLFPTLGVTARSDAHIGMLPIYTAFRASGCSPERAFQWWFLVPFFLNFAASVWSTKRLGFGPIAAATAAYTFTFALPVAAKTIHAQLLPRFFVPLAFVFAWEFFRKPTSWRFAAVSACVVAQTYLTVYIGYFLILLLGAAAVVSMLGFGRQAPWRDLLAPSWREWASRGLIAVMAAIAVLPLVRVHSHGVGRISRAEFYLYSPELASWITPPLHSWSYPELVANTGLACLAEQQVFPGLTPIVAVGLGCLLAFRRSRLGDRQSIVAVSACTVLVLAALVTDFGWCWLYSPFTELPGAGGIRAVSRVVLVLLFPAGIAVGACAEAGVGGFAACGRPAQGLAAALILSLIASDHWLAPTTGSGAEGWSHAHYPVETALTHQQQIAEAIRRRPGAACVHVFPTATDSKSVAVQLEAMRASQDLGVPCVNGWTGHFPRGWDDRTFFPGYRSLMTWLVEVNGLKLEDLAGLVVVGEPAPDANPVYEAAMRALFPPQPTR
jgi:hypothetical protein